MVRIVNGKKYSSYISFKRKSSAQKVAEGYRSRGGNAIVVPIRKKVAGKTYKYGVYTSK